MARERTERLVDHAIALDQIHQSNQVVLYTDALSGQIPRSYAGHAFRQFQRSMYEFELIRLASMWDKPGGDRFSIPTVARLVDDPAVIAAASEQTRARYADPGPVHINAEDAPAAVLEDFRRIILHERQRAAVERATACTNELRQAIQRCAEVVASQEFHALRTLRDHAIAHNLRLPPPGDPAAPEAWRYGGETDLLRDTIVVVNLLHGALHGSSFDWDDMRRQHERNSAHLWEHCTFGVPER